MKLMPVEAARAAMLAGVEPLGADPIPLAEALGRVTAEDIRASRDQPPFRASAMDGWGVRAADTPGELRIVGESAAGSGHEGVLGPGQAIRIFTGAAAPEGCDSVVIQEDAERRGETVAVPASPASDNLRPAGGDFRAGDLLLPKGTRLDPWRLALAASSGRGAISVARRPRLAILPTGEEIVPAGSTPGPFQIFDSGGPSISALAQTAGADARPLPSAGDRLEELVERMRTAVADVLVTVGGASVGDYDLVRAAGAELGLTLAVTSVNVRPGKPTFFGRLADGRMLLGLPGNPASALVCAELFLKPLIRALLGQAPGPAMVQAVAAQPLKANGPREHWMRARLSYEGGRLVAKPMSDQDSSLVSVFAAAGALVRRPAGAPAVEAGATVDILLLDRA